MGEPALYSRLGRVMAWLDTNPGEWQAVDIAQALGITPAQAGTMCSMLALQGKVVKLNSMRYCAAPSYPRVSWFTRFRGNLVASVGVVL